MLVIWSLACAGVGGYLATHRSPPIASTGADERPAKVAGPAVLDKLTEHAQDAVDAIKRKTMNDPAPKERHSASDRSAVDALIAKKGQR